MNLIWMNLQANTFELQLAVMSGFKDASDKMFGGENAKTVGGRAFSVNVSNGGMAKAKYCLMLREAMSGEEAERIGLVALCVDEDKLVEKAFEVANKLAAGSQSAIRWAKYALNNLLRMMGSAFDSSLALEFMGFAGPDVHEGIASHKGKRKPKFDPDCPI